MDPEKKKTIVVGALFVAMLGIGAFQFTKGSGDVPVAEPKPEVAKTSDQEKLEGKESKTKNPMYALALSARDPFRPAPFSVSTPEDATPVAPPATAPAKTPGGKTAPLPDVMGGVLPPMMPGGELPRVGETDPQLPPPLPKPSFQGTLIGVVVGAQSAAVFRLGTSERIVTVGSELEPGVRLLSVSPRRAVLRFHGQILTLNLRDEAPPAPAAPTAVPPAPKLAPTLPQTGSQTSETPND